MLANYLETTGYNVVHCSTVDAMVRVLSSRRMDIIVLDIGLPDGNSLHALAAQRAPHAPVICITANPSVDVRIEALGGVAADILVKPFDERELILRIRNALRPTAAGPAPSVRFDEFTFHLDSGRLERAGGAVVALTTMEHRLLYTLVHHPNRPLSRQWLLSTVFERTHATDERIVDVTVGRLRKKLGPMGQAIIRSVRHVGYQFIAEGDEPAPR